MRRTRSNHRFTAILSQSVLFALPLSALAGVHFSSGSATWSWDADTATSNGGKSVFTITPPSTGSMPTNPSFQLSKSGSFGSASATGKGSIGYVTNSTTASFTLSGGSGATQADPNNEFPGQTVTKVRFSGTFDVTSPSFGPTATGYFSLAVAGVAGINGYAQVAGDVSFKLNNSSGADLRSPISFGDTFNGTGASSVTFSKTYTYCTALSPSAIGASDNLFISGSLTFISSNLGSPSDLTPINLEAGGAPPTATFYVPGGSVGDWFNPASWTPPSDPGNNVFSFVEAGAIVPPIPNGIGQRARFVNLGAEPRGVTINSDATVGAIEIDDDGTVGFSGAGALTMAVQSGNATTHIGSSFGNGAHAISNPVILANDLELRAETATPFQGGSEMTFFGPITNQGGSGGNPRNVEITGRGAFNYNAANDYRGTTAIFDNGTLRANADGCLGTGSVTVSGYGHLELNTPVPFSGGPGAINVSEGGILVLGAGTISGVNIQIIGASAGISGSPAVLGQLTLNTGAGSINMPGGFIGHTLFDLSAAGNPSDIGTSADYIFGLSADAVDPVTPGINIGSGFNTPWLGLGGDNRSRTYGASSNDPAAPLIQVSHTAELRSMAGELIINARLGGASDPANQIFVTGTGIVSLESQFNTYSDRIYVTDAATLRVNGPLPASNVVVQSGGQLGGHGNISGLVEVSDGAVLDPGINFYNTATDQLTVGSLLMHELSVLDFEFGSDGSMLNDTVLVNGNLTLDGLLRVNQLQEFDATTYTLITFTGQLTDNGLLISGDSQPIFDTAASQAASILIVMNGSTPGGTVYLVIPEPTGAAAVAAAVLALRRRNRAAR